MLKLSLLFTTFFIFFLVQDIKLSAQQKKDTLLIKGNTQADTSGKRLLALDTVIRKKYNPKVASLRSAIIPGWGQAYNKKYWKIPIIYGALGTTGYIFFYNLSTYKSLKEAVILLSDSTTSLTDPRVSPLYRLYGVNNLRTLRNEFRQNLDYSVLFFLIFWGLNVVDATVDAHLKAFDVSPNISMKIRPGLNSTNNGPGIAFVFSFRDKHSKVLLPLP
jgi:Family of unknown function (DUF5683)